MKFYFCEACGKRITDQQIEAGAGKNKKLKGVFCETCAVGVTTMDTLPMSDDQARELVKQDEAKTSSTTKRLPRRTSGSRLPVPSGRRDTSRRQIPLPAQSSRSPVPAANPKLWISVGACVSVLVIAIAFAVTGGSEPSTSVVRNPSKVPEKLPEPGGGFDSSDTANLDAAEKAYKGLQQELKAADPEDLPNRIRLAETFLKEFGASDAANNVRSKVNTWREQLEKKNAETAVAIADKKPESKPAEGLKETASGNPTPDADAGKPIVPEPPEKEPTDPVKTAETDRPKGPAPHELAFDKVLKDLLKSIKDEDLGAAEECSKAAAGDESLAALRPAAEALPKVVSALKARKDAAEAALKKLIGRELRVETSRGVRRGKVIKAEKGVLELQQQFKINNQIKGGATHTVRLEELTAEARARLLPPAKPQAPAEWSAGVFSALAAGQEDKADEALAGLKDDVLEAPLQAFVESQREVLADAKAESEWKRLLAQAAGKLDQRQAGKVLGMLDAFSAAHGKTGFFTRTQKERDDFSRNLQSIAGNLQRRIRSVFKGKVLDFDATTRRTTVVYNLRDPNQVADWLVGNKDGFSVAEGKLIGGKGVKRPLRMEAFEPRELSVRIAYEMAVATHTKWSKSNESGERLCVWLGTPIRRKGPPVSNAPAVVFSAGGSWASFAAGHETDAKVYNKGSVAFPRRGTIEVAARKGKLLAFLNDEKFLECERSELKVRSGVAIGGNLAVRIKQVRVSGIPEPKWLQDAVAFQSVMERRSGPHIRWTNGAGDGKWGTAKNWDAGHVPVPGEHVIFDGRSSKSCTAEAGDVTQGLTGFTVAPDFRAAIRFSPNFTKPPSQALTIRGDLTVLGGSLSVAGLVRESTGVGVTIGAENVYVGSRARIHSNGLGFPKGKGPGIGKSACHGGRGVTMVPKCYGDPKAPVTLGSGGPLAAGGGAIKLDVSGEVTVNGVISANAPGNDRHPGAGGSVYIVCKTFAGTGLLQANGGDTRGKHNDCGGGGGRIAVVWKQSTFTGAYECDGGRTAGGRVQPGTVSLPDGADLTVLRPIGLAPGKHVFGDVIVKPGGKLVIHGDYSNGTICELNAKSVVVEKGGVLNADTEGFPPGKGPGGSSEKGVAGSHGGLGGHSKSQLYGNPEAPVTFGSGGMRSYGGGVVKIELGKGVLKVEGRISANGQRGTPYGGAGAGGSVYIKCGSLIGTGSIQARGGTNKNRHRGGGGGGRVAIYCGKSDFKGKIDAAGGPGRDGAIGKKGSVVLRRK